MTYPTIVLTDCDFFNRLKKIKPFICKEETRYYICGVLFHWKDGVLTLAATNGHILCEMVIKDLPHEGNGEFKCTIPFEAVKHLLSIKGKPPCITMQIIDAGKKARFFFLDYAYETALIDGDFVDYKKVIPEKPVVYNQGLKASYLLDALKALDSEAVNLVAENQEGSPHVITADKAEGVTCVIMPMRT